MLAAKYALLCTAVTLVALSAPSPAFAQAPAVVDPAVAKLLAGIRAADKGQLAVSEEDGRFLRVLVGATNAK